MRESVQQLQDVLRQVRCDCGDPLDSACKSNRVIHPCPGRELHMLVVPDHLRLLDGLTVLSRLLAAALVDLSSSYLTLFDASPSIVFPPSSTPSLFRWDAFHFTAIAKNGYSHEHHWAFFPGVPILLRAAHRLPTLFLDVVPPLSWFTILNAAIAIPTTRAIYHLTLIHFRSPSFALLTALLSLLPASPATLYLAPYAEPIFTLLSYQGACTYLYNSPHF